MNSIKRSELEGKHAFLSPSKYHWIRYSVDKLREAYLSSLAVERGVALHDLASRHIKMRIKMPRNNETLNAFVNDAIKFKMRSEWLLYYSDNCFGTADAISFYNDILRIHDLKTGTTPASFDQLMVYAALYCLENCHEPFDIDIELRIYQDDETRILNPEPEKIREIMDTIILFDREIEALKFEGE